MKRFCAIAAFFLASVVATNAQDDTSGFVEANILGIFYHELGHAVIDVEGVPHEQCEVQRHLRLGLRIH